MGACIATWQKNYRPKLDHQANAERAEGTKRREQLGAERQEREVAKIRQKLLESSLPVAKIDFSKPRTSTEEEGSQNEGNEDAFSSGLAAIAVSEGDKIEPKPRAKPASLTTCFRQADIKLQIRISLTLTIKIASALNYRLWKY